MFLFFVHAVNRSPDHPVRCSGPNVEVNLADELVLYGDFHNFGRPPAGNLKVV